MNGKRHASFQLSTLKEGKVSRLLYHWAISPLLVKLHDDDDFKCRGVINNLNHKNQSIRLEKCMDMTTGKIEQGPLDMPKILARNNIWDLLMPRSITKQSNRLGRIKRICMPASTPTGLGSSQASGPHFKAWTGFHSHGRRKVPGKAHLRVQGSSIDWASRYLVSSSRPPSMVVLTTIRSRHAEPARWCCRQQHESGQRTKALLLVLTRPNVAWLQWSGLKESVYPLLDQDVIEVRSHGAILLPVQLRGRGQQMLE